MHQWKKTPTNFKIYNIIYVPVYRGNETVKIAGCTIVRDNPDIIPYMTNVRPWQDLFVRLNIFVIDPSAYALEQLLIISHNIVSMKTLSNITSFH